MRFIDPDSKDGWDKVLDFIAAVSDNLTLGFTQVRDRGATIASNASDYNSGQDLGDLSSIIVGTAMVDGGAAALGGSVVVTASTGGLSSEITIPTALAGASTVFQGASLLTQGTMNLESQKGRSTNTENKDEVKVGRAGKQDRLRELANGPKLGSSDKGWIKQETNQIDRGKRRSIRNPPGKDLAHERGREAAKRYSYKYSNLQDRDLHRRQHKYDKGGRKNKERPIQ